MPQFRIVFHLPEQAKSYYRRHIEMPKVNGVPRTGPEITTLAVDAAKFTSADLAVTARDRFRKDFPRFVVYIEDLHGNAGLFEPRQIQPTIEDHRTAVWVIPDDCEESGMGFLVVPAFTASLGHCWGVRSCDVPSLVAAGEHEILETIYASDPVEAVERARQIWGPIMKPFTHHEIEAKARKEIRQLVAEIKTTHGKAGRPRTGDL